MNDLNRDYLLIKAHCLGKSLAWVFAHPEAQSSEAISERIASLRSRRAKGEPMAYLLEGVEFHDVWLRLTPEVLCPRPETELLVDWGINHITRGANVLELGTGSGAIALALAKARPDLAVTATDISERALDCAKQNAESLGIDMSFITANWCRGIQGPFDAILSNPPYVAKDDSCLTAAPLAYEPRLALDGGVGGLEALDEIIGQAPRCLRQGGSLVLEHGFNQGRSVRALMQRVGFKKIESLRDLAGHERVSFGYS